MSVVDRIVAAFNARDLAAFAGGYAEGIVIEDARVVDDERIVR